MNKWKMAFILLLTAVIFYIAGCSATSAKLDIPNLGILQPISWQSIDDPMYGNGNIHQFVFEDKEKGYEYILFQSHYGLTVTKREKKE